MLLFLTTNVAAVTSFANQQLLVYSINIQVSFINSIINKIAGSHLL